MERDMSQELVVKTELRWMLDRYEMEIFYQPIMDLKNGRIAGSESLLVGIILRGA
jgi:sensor c-di-GMP phosphodiesterase-like protein